MHSLVTKSGKDHDDSIEVYNNERPPLGLGGLYPVELFSPSARAFFQPQVPDYPCHGRPGIPGDTITLKWCASPQVVDV